MLFSIKLPKILRLTSNIYYNLIKTNCQEVNPKNIRKIIGNGGTAHNVPAVGGVSPAQIILLFLKYFFKIFII
jgi:hypothetical protein